jgi:ABC-2 type transport system permease protein
MWTRIRHMLVKEFIQLFRDPRMRPIIFAVPVVQMVIFGYAATTDVKHIRLAVQDLDNSVSSRGLAAEFVTSRYFEVVERVEDEAAVRGLLDRGAVQAVLRLEPGFDADLGAGRSARVQLLVDGSDSNTAGIILSYAARIIEQFSQQVAARILARLSSAGRTPPRIDLQTRAWFNENLESRHFYVPGVIANIILILTLLLTSMAVVREKEIGTMEQIIVTPIRRFEFILGKTLPFVLVGFADVVLVSVVGLFWFQVPLRGSLALLALATLLSLMSTLGMGLLISTVSRTQQQAMMTTFFYAFPAILLSGFMFPIANMPEVIQWVTCLNPLRYFLVILRGLFLKGVGFGILWPQLAGLFLLGSATLCLAALRFRKTLA